MVKNAKPEREASRDKRLVDSAVLRHDAVTLLIMVLACAVQGLAINGFYVQHSFLSGGITGVALLLDYSLEVPTWLTILVLNIPVCIVGFKYLNLKLVVFSIIGTALLTLSIVLTEGFIIPIENELVAAIVGSAIIGVSAAPVVRRDATLGGLDIVSLILAKRFSISMGTINIMFNIVIMLCLGLVKGIEIALCSMIAMFVSNVAFSYALTGLNRTVSVFIISDKWDEITPDVMNIMHRGVTYIPAQGAYTGIERKLVYCIVKTAELATLKRIVKAKDENALFSILETKEVLGRGFNALN
ncbi:MAG: YitT family protein [Clostridia bacterium]|nr:YitT family protein [Clostridia bacterium]